MPWFWWPSSWQWSCSCTVPDCLGGAHLTVVGHLDLPAPQLPHLWLFLDLQQVFKAILHISHKCLLLLLYILMACDRENADNMIKQYTHMHTQPQNSVLAAEYNLANNNNSMYTRKWVMQLRCFCPFCKSATQFLDCETCTIQWNATKSWFPPVESN